jgi:hypothetical protein
MFVGLISLKVVLTRIAASVCIIYKKSGKAGSKLDVLILLPSSWRKIVDFCIPQYQYQYSFFFWRLGYNMHKHHSEW